MWIRSELKQRAKDNLKRYRRSAILACLILLVLQMLAGTGNSNSSATSSSNSTYNYMYNEDIYDNQEDDSGAAYGLYTDDSFLSGIANDSEGALNYLEEYVMNESGLGMFSSILTTELVFMGILLAILRVILNFVIINPVIVGHASFFYKNRYEKTSVGELAFAMTQNNLQEKSFRKYTQKNASEIGTFDRKNPPQPKPRRKIFICPKRSCCLFPLRE